MAEVTRMWSGLLSRTFSHKDAPQAEIEQGSAPSPSPQPKSGLQSENSHLENCEQILSPRTAPVDIPKRSTPLLARRGSPSPAALSLELQAHKQLTSQKALLEETSELLLRTTPVVEFIEYYRNRVKSKKRRGKVHRRRNSEPVSFAGPKDRTSRSLRTSESMNTPPMASRGLDHSGVMGKSASLRDIFTLKKVPTNGASFFLKPGQFLAHLRTQPTPSLSELQRLQHILEGKQMAFVQKFVEKGGAMTLFSIMSGCSRKKQPTDEDSQTYIACCNCIFALLSACEEYEALVEKMTLAISSLLAKEMPRSADYLLTCANQIGNIITMCKHSFGHKLVLQEMKQREDFPLLMILLQNDLSVEGDSQTENIHIKVAILTLIAKLILHLEEQEQKFKLINTFLGLKLFPVIMDIRRRLDSPELHNIITEVEELVLKEYYILLPLTAKTGKTTPKSDPTHILTVRIPLFNVTHAVVQVPYDPASTTVCEVITRVYQQVAYLLQFDEKSYGIFLVDKAELVEKKVDEKMEPIAEAPQPINIYASVRASRRISQEDLNAFSLASSGELVGDNDDDVDPVEKSKSPRLNRRRSYHKPQEIVVQNPLYGKTNPILKQTRNRRLSIYTNRVLTLSSCNNEGEDDDLVTSKLGEWQQGTIKVSALSSKGWDFKLKPWNLVITWKKRQILVEVNPDSTTFSDLTEQILIHLNKHDEDRIFEYNLVMLRVREQDEPPEVVWLESMKYVSSLPPRVRELELRTRPMQLQIHSKDSTTHSVLVNESTTLQQVIKEFGNKLGLHGRHLQDYGLYDNVTEEWLEAGDVLPLLQRVNIDLHFLLRPRPIQVFYQIAEHVEVTRKERLTGNFSNLALYESPSQGNYLNSSQENIPSFDEFDGIHGGVSKEPHSFKTKDLLVHFTLCVSQVQSAVCKQLGLDPDGYAMYKEAADDSAVVELTPWKSLRNQGVTPNSHVLLLRATEREETGNDVNIWDELQEGNIRFEEGSDKKKVVVAGTLNQLVRALTSETDHDVFFLETFMLTYRSFTDHKTLLRKLGERYTTPNIDPGIAKTIKSQVCIVLKYWITHEDLSDKEVILDEIAKFVDSIAEEFSDMVSRLEKFIQIERDRLNAPTKSDIVTPPEDNRLSPGMFNLNLLDLDEYTIACQLALQDSERFSKLKTVEFFGQAWLKNKAPNLLAMVAHFNSISSAVATSIVSERLIKKRVKIVEKHITIASYLRKLNDFFSLQAFICGINSSAVNRLKFTMERISSQHAQTLAELEELMNMENSYKNYRQALRDAKGPCVPHIGVYMTDLTFIDEGNSDNYGNLINFQKRTLVSKILMEIESHRELKYQLTAVKKIEQFINSLPRLPENEMYWASLECEPRGASKSSLK